MRPSITLAELMSLNGPEFVSTAYETVLGRPADPDGMAYYVARLRTGYSKMSVLHQLASGEASEVDQVPGLRKALSRYGKGRMPLLGPVFRRLFRVEGESVSERLQRSIISELAALQVEIQNLASAGFARAEPQESTGSTALPPSPKTSGRNPVADHLSPRAREIFERLISS